MSHTDRTRHLRPASGRWSRRVREKLAETDWEEWPVVDVVSYAPATSTGFEDDRRHVEVHRHREPPPPESYETTERTCRVERLTRPLYERLVGRE